MEKALDIFCTENPIRALRMRVLSLIYAMQNLNDVHGRIGAMPVGRYDPYRLVIWEDAAVEILSGYEEA